MIEVMRRSLRQKKGNLFDILGIGVVLFVLAISILVGKLALSKTVGRFNGTAAGIDTGTDAVNRSVAIMSESDDNFVTLFDIFFMTIFIGLAIVTIISAFLIKTFPAFFIISVLALVVFGVIFWLFEQSYNQIAATDTVVGNVSDEFTKMNYMMDNFGFILIVLGFVILIVLYAKTNDGGGGGVI